MPCLLGDLLLVRWGWTTTRVEGCCEGVKGQNAKYPPNDMPDNGLGAKFEKSLRQVCKEIEVHVEGKELTSTNLIFSIGESPKHFDEVSIMFWMEVLPFGSHTTSPKLLNLRPRS